MPAGATPAIDATILQVPSCCHFSSSREARVAAHRAHVSLWHHDYPDWAFPCVTHQSQCDLRAIISHNFANDLVNVPVLSINAVDRHDSVTLKDPHASSWLIIDANPAVDLVCIAVRLNLGDASAFLVFLWKIFNLQAQRFGNGNVEDCIGTHSLHLPVPLDPACHLPGNLRCCSRGCSHRGHKPHDTNKRRCKHSSGLA
mmetsp:Transcript_125550/g.250475  ORF Transcript_125550/g.250475 Transcript_125550/m.250475 type:complete len:200 (+) Transcript_125550:377-976(+)